MSETPCQWPDELAAKAATVAQEREACANVIHEEQANIWTQEIMEALVMNDLYERAKAALEGATSGPWAYRPQEHDDWGVVRGPDLGNGWLTFICQAKDNRVSDQGEALARLHGVDPWEANARLIALAPDLARAYIAQHEAQVKVVKLIFTNADATPKTKILTVSADSVAPIMDWYGAFHAGDRYTVTVDGRNVPMGINGEVRAALQEGRRPYMGQIMAECDCTNPVCWDSGRCIAQEQGK